MNRREPFKTLSAALPAGATMRLEPALQPDDLIVIQANEPLTTEEMNRIAAAVESLAVRSGWADRPKVLVLDSSLSLRVERSALRADAPRHVHRFIRALSYSQTERCSCGLQRTVGMRLGG